MRSDEQAEAYLDEARLTAASARAIFEAAETHEEMWAQVVKNAYDAIEQAISAGIASTGEAIPRNHPGKVNTFREHLEPGAAIEELLLYWLQRRGDSQYVDIRGDRIIIPHEQFDREDAARIMEDMATILELVTQLVEDP